MKKNRIIITDWILILLILYITVSSIFPYFRLLYGLNTLFSTLCMLLWLIITFCRNPKFYLRIKSDILIPLLFIIVTFILPYIAGNSTLGNRFLNISPLFFFIIVFNYYYKYNKLNQVKIIVCITIPFIVLTLYNTLKALIENPLISRSINNFGESSIELYSKLIGGYEFLYLLVLLIPITFYYLFYSKRSNHRLFKLFVFVFFICAFITIIMANYLTALFASILSIIIIIFVDTFIYKKNMFLSLTLIFIIILIVYFHENVFLIIVNFVKLISGTNLTYYRLLELQYSLTYGNDVLIETSRWDLMAVSFFSFIESPFIGTLGQDSSIVFSFTYGSGQHSHAIDTFAYFGFLIGVIQIYLFLFSFIKNFKYKSSISLTISLMVTFIIIFTFDNVTPSMAYAVVLLYLYIIFTKNKGVL